MSKEQKCLDVFLWLFALFIVWVLVTLSESYITFQKKSIETHSVEEELHGKQQNHNQIDNRP